MYNSNFFNHATLIKFYKGLMNVDFSSMSLERKEELENIVDSHRTYFNNRKPTKRALIQYCVEKLMTSYQTFGLVNDTEQIYFLIKMIDPEFQFLEILEVANTIKELKTLSFVNFGYFDPYIIKYEKAANKVFLEFEPDDLFDRNSIKRTRNI